MFTSLVVSALAATSLAAPTVSGKFHLKTTSSDPRFNNKCVTGYHTGAGTSDATLALCDDVNKVYYINGTQIQSSIFGYKVPAAVYADNGASYNNWYPVSIDTGYGTSGFKFSDKEGYLQESGTGFIGCIWAHDLNPQLFSVAVPVYANKLPDTCAHLKLVRG